MFAPSDVDPVYAALLRCVLPCHFREEDAIIHQLVKEDRTKWKMPSAFSVVGVLFTVKLQTWDECFFCFSLAILFGLVLIFSSGLLQICSECLALQLNVWQFGVTRHLYFANRSRWAFHKGCTRSATFPQQPLFFLKKNVSGGKSSITSHKGAHITCVFCQNVWLFFFFP